MIRFEELSADTSLLYYDGPILSLYRDADGDGYLVLWVDQDAMNTWLCAKPKQDLIEHFVRGSIDLLTILESSSECSLFEQDAERPCFNQREIKLSDYPQYLPEEGVFL